MGVEVSPDVKRDEVEGIIKKILDGEEGMKMRAKAKDWKSKLWITKAKDHRTIISRD